MSPALIQLFAFMTCTFVLGLFLGWALWRYGGVSKAAMEDLEAKVQYWKKSFDQSRLELWNLQEGKSSPHSKPQYQSRPTSSHRRITEPVSKPSSSMSVPSSSAQG